MTVNRSFPNLDNNINQVNAKVGAIWIPGLYLDKAWYRRLKPTAAAEVILWHNTAVTLGLEPHEFDDEDSGKSEVLLPLSLVTSVLHRFNTWVSFGASAFGNKTDGFCCTTGLFLKPRKGFRLALEHIFRTRQDMTF